MNEDPPADLSDLVGFAGAGDQQAWGRLVERFAPLLWSVCRRYRLSDADAHDVAQTVWLRLLERIDTIREPAALPGWLATTTARECLRVLRVGDRTAFDEVTDELLAAAVDVPTPEEAVVVAERNDTVRAAVAELPDHCRQLFALLTRDPALPYKEIGELLGRPAGAIGPTRARCLEKLRQSRTLASLLQDVPGPDQERGAR